MSNMLWLGILLGVLVGTFAPQLVKIAVFLIALLLSDLIHGVSHGVHNVSNLHFAMPLWLIGVAGLGVGLWAWHYARKRGLEQLGEAELKTRWTNVRGISKWGW